MPNVATVRVRLVDRSPPPASGAVGVIVVALSAFRSRAVVVAVRDRFVGVGRVVDVAQPDVALGQVEVGLVFGGGRGDPHADLALNHRVRRRGEGGDRRQVGVERLFGGEAGDQSGHLGLLEGDGVGRSGGMGRRVDAGRRGRYPVGVVVVAGEFGEDLTGGAAFGDTLTVAGRARPGLVGRR